jgi:hypothetical protein
MPRAIGRLAAESEIIFIIEETERKRGSYICIPIIAAISNIYRRLSIKNSRTERIFSFFGISLKRKKAFFGFNL